METYTEKLTILTNGKVLKMNKILVFINSC